MIRAGVGYFHPADPSINPLELIIMTGYFETVIGPRINNILAVSEFMTEEISHRLSQDDEYSTAFSVREDYSFGWKEVVENTIGFGSVKGFIFSGADGCGKHTASDIACNMLTEQKGYSLTYLGSDDLVFTEAETKADDLDRQKKIEKGDTGSFTDDIIHSFFECLFSMFEEDVPVCLVVDDTAGNGSIDAVYRRLGKYLCIGQPELFVIIIEKNESLIPSLLRKQLRLIRMSPPDENQRTQLLKNVLGETTVNSKATLELLSKATEDYTYSQLKDLACNIRFYDITGQNITTEYLNEIALSQYPVPAENSGLEEERIRLYRKLQELIDMAPELMTRMPASAAVSVRAAEPEKKQEDMESLDEKDAAIDAQKASEKSRIEDESPKMPLKDLMSVSLGEKIMQKINNAGIM